MLLLRERYAMKALLRLWRHTLLQGYIELLICARHIEILWILLNTLATRYYI